VREIGIVKREKGSKKDMKGVRLRMCVESGENEVVVLDMVLLHGHLVRRCGIGWHGDKHSSLNRTSQPGLLSKE